MGPLLSQYLNGTHDTADFLKRVLPLVTQRFRHFRPLVAGVTYCRLFYSLRAIESRTVVTTCSDGSPTPRRRASGGGWTGRRRGFRPLGVGDTQRSFCGPRNSVSVLVEVLVEIQHDFRRMSTTVSGNTVWISNQATPSPFHVFPRKCQQVFNPLCWRRSA